MEQLFIEEKNLNSKKPTVAFKAKKQVMTTSFPEGTKTNRSTGTKPSKFLVHLFVSNQDRKLANRLSADETTAVEQVIEGFAPDHPGRKTVSKEHKISRVFFCTLQH